QCDGPRILPSVHADGGAGLQLLIDLLRWLNFAQQDAEAVLRKFPSREKNPEVWTLVERGSSELLRVIAEGTKEAPPRDDAVWVILAAMDGIREVHRRWGIPEDISRATLSRVGRLAAEHREPTRWEWLRFKGWLFEVGELEVTPYRLLT